MGVKPHANQPPLPSRGSAQIKRKHGVASVLLIIDPFVASLLLSPSYDMLCYSSLYKKALGICIYIPIK